MAIKRKSKPVIRYKESDKERAYKLWFEVDSFSHVAKLLGISLGTIMIWQKKQNWPQRKIDDKKYLAEIEKEKAIETIGQMKDMAEEIGFSEMDYKTFRDIRIVEKLCIATIQGNKEILSQAKQGEIPTTFKDAIDGLKKCWDSKEKILSRYTTKKKDSNDADMVINNFFNMVKQTANKTEVIDVGVKQLNR